MYQLYSSSLVEVLTTLILLFCFLSPQPELCYLQTSVIIWRIMIYGDALVRGLRLWLWLQPWQKLEYDFAWYYLDPKFDEFGNPCGVSCPVVFHFNLLIRISSVAPWLVNSWKSIQLSTTLIIKSRILTFSSVHLAWPCCNDLMRTFLCKLLFMNLERLVSFHKGIRLWVTPKSHHLPPSPYKLISHCNVHLKIGLRDFPLPE